MTIYFRGTAVRRIAQSGIAELFLTVQHGFAGLEKLVVIKNLLPAAREDPQFLPQFLEQARKSATIQHQGLVGIYDVVHDTTDTFLTREYVSGEDLGYVMRTLATERKALPPVLACRIIAGAAAGLHQAHEATDPEGASLNLIHGDLTPGNILVAYTGSTKVLDVGLHQANPTGAHLDPGSRLAREAYRSPEQLLGQPVDRRTDVYTLGVLLHELLSGQPLFWQHQGSTRDRVLQGNPPPLRTLAPETPRELDQLVQTTLQRDPEQRPRTAHSLYLALEEVLKRYKGAPSEIEVGNWLTECLARRLEERRQLERELISESRLPATQAAELQLQQAHASGQYPSVTPPGISQVGRETRISGHYPTTPSALQDGLLVPEPTPKRRRGPLLLIVVVLLAMLFGSIVGLVVWRATRSNSWSEQDRAGELAGVTNASGQGLSANERASTTDSNQQNTPSALLVRVFPEGARVVANGRVLSEEVTEDGVLVPAQPNTRVTLELSKEGYSRAERSVVAPALGTRNVVVRLSKRPPKPVLSADAPTTAQDESATRTASRRSPRRAAPSPRRRRIPTDVSARRARRSSAPRVARTKPKPKPTTSLVVEFSPPSATVSIDGIERPGRSPLRLKNLAPGNHTIVVSADAYETSSRSLNLAEDEERLLVVELEREEIRGPVVISSDPPGAAVTIEGLRYGTTPATGVELPPGRHEVTLVKEGYKPWRGNVTINARGDAERLSATLVAKAPPSPVEPPPAKAPTPRRPKAAGTGQIYVASPNVYGAVWVNGREIGFPPVVATKIPVGTALIEVRVGGKARRARRVTVKKDEQIRIMLR
jgi:serine/threonine protein kinase